MKRFRFEKKEQKPEKLPATLDKAVKDARQKRADEALRKTNLRLLGIAGLLGALLLILTIAKHNLVS